MCSALWSAALLLLLRRRAVAVVAAASPILGFRVEREAEQDHGCAGWSRYVGAAERGEARRGLAGRSAKPILGTYAVLATWWCEAAVKAKARD